MPQPCVRYVLHQFPSLLKPEGFTQAPILLETNAMDSSSNGSAHAAADDSAAASQLHEPKVDETRPWRSQVNDQAAASPGQQLFNSASDVEQQCSIDTKSQQEALKPPHVLVLIFGMGMFAAIMTYLIKYGSEDVGAPIRDFVGFFAIMYVTHFATYMWTTMATEKGLSSYRTALAGPVSLLFSALVAATFAYCSVVESECKDT